MKPEHAGNIVVVLVVVVLVIVLVVVVIPHSGGVGFAAPRQVAMWTFNARRQAFRHDRPALSSAHGCRHAVASCWTSCRHALVHRASATPARRPSATWITIAMHTTCFLMRTSLQLRRARAPHG